jgi:protoheme IX farnesyltransferase
MSDLQTTLATAPSSLRDTARELWALTKPRITLMVVITAAGGMWLAPGAITPVSLVAALSALALVVGGANALNCWLERDVDALMARTASRPLPARRLAPRPALLFGLGLGAVSIPALWLLVNPLTALLGAASLVLYVCVYTPMKQITPSALLVGAIPGAMPPLMGWTAVTDRVELPGLVLFGILFLWQLPHFIAISIVRQDDYERAGLKVLPSVRGERASRAHAFGWALLLVPVTVLPTLVGVAGWGYFTVGLGAALAYVTAAAAGLVAPAGETRWAKRLFLVSLAYLPIVFAALMIDAG